jgi:hypothetical protein
MNQGNVVSLQLPDKLPLAHLILILVLLLGVDM